jgi:hypothetical protein
MISTGLPSATTTRLFICERLGQPREVRDFGDGLAAGRVKLLRGQIAGRVGGGRRGGNRNCLSPNWRQYPHFGQRATKSSPASDATMNSCDWLPPMAPECASTAI